MINKFNVLAGGLEPPPGLVKDNNYDFNWLNVIAIIIIALLCMAMIWGLIKSITVTKKHDEEHSDDSSNKSDK